MAAQFGIDRSYTSTHFFTGGCGDMRGFTNAGFLSLYAANHHPDHGEGRTAGCVRRAEEKRMEPRLEKNRAAARRTRGGPGEISQPWSCLR
ncbi:hypothetical protein GCM10010271_00080 [Streptomyces kurssanovii]|nr:hypothetical protein GCM10010271_00080 [Streptomyces kurssanovii]